MHVTHVNIGSYQLVLMFMYVSPIPGFNKGFKERSPFHLNYENTNQIRLMQFIWRRLPLKPIESKKNQMGCYMSYKNELLSFKMKFDGADLLISVSLISALFMPLSIAKRLRAWGLDQIWLDSRKTDKMTIPMPKQCQCCLFFLKKKNPKRSHSLSLC